MLCNVAIRFSIKSHYPFLLCSTSMRQSFPTFSDWPWTFDHPALVSRVMGLQASNPTSNEETSESERILLITLYQKKHKIQRSRHSGEHTTMSQLLGGWGRSPLSTTVWGQTWQYKNGLKKFLYCYFGVLTEWENTQEK